MRKSQALPFFVDEMLKVALQKGVNIFNIYGFAKIKNVWYTLCGLFLVFIKIYTNLLKMRDFLIIFKYFNPF